MSASGSGRAHSLMIRCLKTTEHFGKTFEVVVEFMIGSFFIVCGIPVWFVKCRVDTDTLFLHYFLLLRDVYSLLGSSLSIRIFNDDIKCSECQS